MIYLCDEKGLVIEGNTIYEIDLDCYECLSEEAKNRYYGEGHEVKKAGDGGSRISAENAPA